MRLEVNLIRKFSIGRLKIKTPTWYQAYSWKDPFALQKLYAGLCSGDGQILTSMITWINTQVDDVPLPLAPLLLVHLQHPPHRQQHARVSWRPWGDVDEDESWPTSTSCLVLCKWGSNDPKTPGRVTWLPGSPPNLLRLLPRVPLHHRPHHCRHHHREISGWKNILFDIFRWVLITCPTIIAIYQIKHVSPSCHIQTNISAIIT